MGLVGPGGLADPLVGQRNRRPRIAAQGPQPRDVFERARDEGVIFDWLTLPTRFLAGEDGWVRGLECIRTELGEPDASGRRRPVPVPVSAFVMEADLADVIASDSGASVKARSIPLQD